MKRRFEFNLSFQQGYGVYKLSHATESHSSVPLEKPAYHSLFNCDFPNTRLDALESGGISSLAHHFDFSTTCPVDSSSHADLLLEAVAGGGEALADCPPLPHEDREGDDDFRCIPSLPSNHREQDHNDTSSVFEGPERRLSHEECRKIELTDWEWCRSKSERTPRQVRKVQNLILNFLGLFSALPKISECKLVKQPQPAANDSNTLLSFACLYLCEALMDCD